MRSILRAAVAALSATLAVVLVPAGAQASLQGFSGAWSGLVTGGGGYLAVTADVTVPRVTTACGRDSAVALFVGIGGWGGLPFAQNGITVTPKGVGVWGEVHERSGVSKIVGARLAIRPGDRVRLSTTFSPKRYYLTLRWHNLTTGRSAAPVVLTNANRYYNGRVANYVVERSNFPYPGAPLARYSPVTFTNAKALQYGRWAPAQGPRTTRVTLLNGRAQVMSRVVRAAGTSLTTHWSRCR